MKAEFKDKVYEVLTRLFFKCTGEGADGCVIDIQTRSGKIRARIEFEYEEADEDE